VARVHYAEVSVNTPLTAILWPEINDIWNGSRNRRSRWAHVVLSMASAADVSATQAHAAKNGFYVGQSGH
jgi:hypothetical protein